MTTPSEPGDRRRLDRAPGERYRPAAAAPPPGAEPAGPPTPLRAITVAAGIALAGALAIVVLGGVLTLTAGLLVVVGVVGWAIGRTVAHLPRALLAAVPLAVGSVLLGQLGLWVFAAAQGGSLGLVDYLVETRGLLVVAELLIAAGAAALTAR